MFFVNRTEVCLLFLLPILLALLYMGVYSILQCVNQRQGRHWLWFNLFFLNVIFQFGYLKVTLKRQIQIQLWFQSAADKQKTVFSQVTKHRLSVHVCSPHCDSIMQIYAISLLSMIFFLTQSISVSTSIVGCSSLV